MIRYDVSEEELRRRIALHAPSWLTRAAQRTEQFRAAGRYDEATGIWGEIKAVYAEIQRGKCAFCERRLPDLQYGSGEHDVEHFRPKGDVQEWPSAHIAAERALAYDFSLGPPLRHGYFLLAYHPLNYAIACRTCNSGLKSSFFPVAGPRCPTGDHPRDYSSERPFLIYPIGTLDTDPEELLTFNGVVCVPKQPAGHNFWRAKVTIEFFALNGNGRDDLERRRADIICALYLALRTLQEPEVKDTARRCAEAVIRSALSPHGEQTNCARAFHRLFLEDQAEAERYAQRAGEYLDTQS